MASPHSTIDGHRQRDKIIDAIAAGQPYRDISAWTEPRVSIGAISRYKIKALAEHDRRVSDARRAIQQSVSAVPDAKAVTAVTGAALSMALDPFMLRVLNQDKRRASWMDDLEQAPEASDYRTLAQLDRNDLAAQEYLARLAGRLDNNSSQVNVTIVQAQPSQAPAPDDVITIDITQK